MKQFLILISIILSVLVFSCQTTKKNITLLSPEQLQTNMRNNDSIQLIDVRRPSEYVIDHIPNAVNINFLSNDFSSKVAKLNKYKPVYLYCRSGKRSGKSAIEFEKAGFTKIYDLEGGILNWKSKGFK